MTKIAILHTSPATLDPLKALAAELMPGVEVINFLDDSILPELARKGGQVDAVASRLIHYARFAQDAGADAILSACSSVGEVAARMRQHVSVPVVRIDDAMADEAVARGRRIGVAATLRTTLQPTTRLLQARADAAGKQVELVPALIDSAYQRLIAGDKDGHDALLVEALAELADRCDVVVLAQASMARVLPRLPNILHGKFLTSPRPGMLALMAALDTGKSDAAGH
jgi:aspartate/glutamate racemase